MPKRDDPLWHFVHNRLPGPPSARFLGWRCVELDVARGTIAVEFAPKPECLNPAGGIAGGFIAHMLDATMGPGAAITLAPGPFPTTVEFKVCFLCPVRLGTVIGRAHRASWRGHGLRRRRTARSRQPTAGTAMATLRIVTIPNVELDFGQGVAEHTW